MSRRESRKRLIVEGAFDETFFKAMLREAGFGENEIVVGCPTKFGAGGDGKGNALTRLEDLVPQFLDGSLTHLGIVIDADFPDPSNAGFFATRVMLDEVMRRLEYARVQPRGAIGLV